MDFDTVPEFRDANSPIHRARAAIFRAALAIALAILPAVSLALPPSVLAPWLEEVAPELTLDMLDGEETALNSYRDRVVIVHFFATWCEPCVEELASLRALNQRMKDQPFAILAVNVGEIDARVRNFVRKHPVEFPVLMDRDRAATKLWQVTALPSSYVLKPGLAPAISVRGDIDWVSPETLAALDATVRPAARTISTTTGEAEGRKPE